MDMKKHISKILVSYFLPAISIICLMGCANFAPYRSNYFGTDHVVNKNYELGVMKKTYVGEAMINVKDYYLSRFSAKSLSPNVDMTVGGLAYHAKDEYEILGTTVKAGINYYLIGMRPSNPRNQLLLISENGEVDGKNIIRNPSLGIYQSGFRWKINPPDVKFTMQDITKTDTSQGYENYELIYTGKDNDALHITYREYSPEDLARTAFFQNLTYPADAKVIRFKEFKILVDEATSESITFKVVEEG